jgi:hypothetical protein
MPISNSETRRSFCDGLGRNILVFCWSQYHPSWSNYCKEVRGQVGQPGASHDPDDIPDKDVVFQDNNAPIHTAATIQIWFDEHKDEQHFPWPEQSQDLNITEPLWSVLETEERDRFSSPSYLKQLNDILQN